MNQLLNCRGARTLLTDWLVGKAACSAGRGKWRKGAERYHQPVQAAEMQLRRCGPTAVVR